MIVALVKIDCQAEDMSEILALIEKMAPVFARQKGYVSAATYKHTDGTQIVRQMNWETLADHEACTRSPEVLAEGEAFMNWIVSGRVTMDVQTYEIVEG